MVMAVQGHRAADALDLLRGYAFSHGRDLDSIATDVAHARISLAQLLLGST